jgi:3-hydroxyanthranilate 3,4-dioxygenase
MSTPFTPVNVDEYIAEIAPTLKPPVANRVWFTGPQFFVMVVGGPNQRDDFHLQPGQELFWQVRGGMCLDVMEEGDSGLIRKKIPIQDGEMFLLPKLTHHSPQRFPDTIGIVCERIRASDDVDHLKWFQPNKGEILYEESFHCSDIGSQLKMVIERFFASPEYEVLKATPKQEIEVSTQFIPFNLDNRIEEVKLSHTAATAGSDAGSPKCTIITDGEFIVRVFTGTGPIHHPIWQGDTFLFQKSGRADVNVALTSITETPADTASVDIPMAAQYSLERCHATWFPRSPAGSTVVINMSSPDSCLMMITCCCGIIE